MKHLSIKQNVKGFTLIEVLIAAVILFSALAITAELYSASSLSANKATEKARFYQINPIAISAIKADIRSLTENRRLTELSNEFTIYGINYQWQAKRTAFKSRATDFDDFEPPPNRFGLFNVNVVAKLSSNNVNENNKLSEFQFQVATW